MQLTLSFLWTCMLLYHDCVRVMGAPPLKKMAMHLTCGVNSTCAERTAKNQVCGCDRLCEVYGDCCSDYTRPGDGSVPADYTRPGDGSVPPGYTRPDDGSVPPQEASLSSGASVLHPSAVSCVDTLVDGGYLLVSTCPTNWKPDHVSMVCESDYYGLSPAYVIPVTSMKSRLSYKNMFCAYCHGQTLYDIKLWPFSHTCDIETNNMTFATMFVYVSQLSYCAIKMDESMRRGCLIGMQDCRGVDVHDDKTMVSARDMCYTYTDYVTSSTAMYKNAYCQHCHREMDTSPLECLHSPVGKFIALHLPIVLQLSRLAQFDDGQTDHNPPTLDYNSLKEHEAKCESYQVYARNRCWYVRCPPGYSLSGLQCTADENVLPKVIYCSPGWNSADPPFLATRMYKTLPPPTQCENDSDYAGMSERMFTEDEMVAMIRSWLEQTNYKAMYMSLYLPTTPRMFGNCQSTTTTGRVAENNAQLLAFVDHVRYNMTWPWAVNLNVTQGNGSLYLGEMTLCEMVSICSTLRTNVGELGPDFRNVSFIVGEKEYVCEEEVKSVERKERDERNERLKAFLQRTEMVHMSTDCCTATRMGVTLVVMLLIWV